jgi:hypothetical protein
MGASFLCVRGLEDHSLAFCLPSFYHTVGDLARLFRESACGRFDYARSDEEICGYFADLRRYADAIGLEIGQTHGRIQGLKDFKKPRGMVCTLKDSF